MKSLDPKEILEALKKACKNGGPGLMTVERIQLETLLDAVEIKEVILEKSKTK